MSTQLTEIGKVNSVSYQDLVGLLSGIDRILGESTAAFKKRIELNSISQKSHTYIGTLENINTRLNLGLYNAINITGPTITDISYTFGLVSVTVAGTIHTVPTLTISPDGFWVWEMLSNVVVGLNAIDGVTATLLSEDGPTIQLSKQKNSGWVINELITSQVYTFDKAGYVPGSIILSTPNLVYTIVNNTITFAVPPTTGLSVCYQYRSVPYNLVASEGAIISLTDPALENYLIYNNDLIYQVKEAIQALMAADGSYWGK